MSDCGSKAASETCSDVLSGYRLESATYTGSYGTCGEWWGNWGAGGGGGSFTVSLYSYGVPGSELALEGLHASYVLNKRACINDHVNTFNKRWCTCDTLHNLCILTALSYQVSCLVQWTYMPILNPRSPLQQTRMRPHLIVAPSSISTISHYL